MERDEALQIVGKVADPADGIGGIRDFLDRDLVGAALNYLAGEVRIIPAPAWYEGGSTCDEEAETGTLRVGIVTDEGAFKVVLGFERIETGAIAKISSQIAYGAFERPGWWIARDTEGRVAKDGSGLSLSKAVAWQVKRDEIVLVESTFQVNSYGDDPGEDKSGFLGNVAPRFGWGS